MKRSEIDTGVVGRTAPYSDAVVLDDRHRWLVTSGTAGFDVGGKLADDFTAQAECAWRNTIAALEQGGMSTDDIVRVTHYLMRRDDLPIYRDICRRILGTARPTSMLMFVTSFPNPKMLIEITVEAARPLVASALGREFTERQMTSWF
jgi:enamine deaminase RidA (YjgF/YER057c/UK114 family)